MDQFMSPLVSPAEHVISGGEMNQIQTGKKKKLEDAESELSSESVVQQLPITKESWEIKQTVAGRKRKINEDEDACNIKTIKKTCIRESLGKHSAKLVQEKLNEPKILPKESKEELAIEKNIEEKNPYDNWMQKGFVKLFRLCEVFTKPFYLLEAWWKIKKIRASPEHDYVLRLYTIDSFIGQGSFGQVYAGCRIQDKLPVAIKFLKKAELHQKMHLPEKDEFLPIEIALLELVNQAPASPRVIQLLDHFETSSHYLLVMEWPEPCKSLFDFLYDEGQGRLDELLAKVIFRQLVEAVMHCLSRGIFHTNIKLENIIIQTTTHQVKLIDLSGGVWGETEHSVLLGNKSYFPPEFFLEEEELAAGPANVWALGVTLFHMACGYLPFQDFEQLIAGKLSIETGLSRECQSLIRQCLAFREEDRPALEEILLQPWLA